MMMPGRAGIEAGLKVAQAGLTRKLGLDHHHEMLESGKVLAPFVATMGCDKAGDPAPRKVLYERLEKAYSHHRVRF